MTEITSAANKTVKHIRALAAKKERMIYGEYTVEGIKSVNEAILSDKEVLCVAVSDEFDVKLLENTDAEIYVMPQFVFEKISDTKNPQGVLAVLKQDKNELTELKKGGLYLYCDGIADPGNMGTLIRTADAAGFDAVINAPECTEIYNPKTVRASMGSFFRMKVYENVAAERLKALAGEEAVIYGGALNDDTIDYRKADYSKTSIIAVGNEANGLSKEILDICRAVKIPIYGKAESLNAAVAAAILMYEAANRRSDC